MKISCIGTGYVGLIVGVCLADMGNDVICVDIDKDKVDKLNKGIPTIYEQGLETILKRNLKEKRLTFHWLGKQKGIKLFLQRKVKGIK